MKARKKVIRKQNNINQDIYYKIAEQLNLTPLQVMDFIEAYTNKCRSKMEKSQTINVRIKGLCNFEVDHTHLMINIYTLINIFRYSKKNEIPYKREDLFYFKKLWYLRKEVLKQMLNDKRRNTSLLRSAIFNDTYAKQQAIKKSNIQKYFRLHTGSLPNDNGGLW